MVDLALPSRQFRSDLPTLVAAASIALRPLVEKRSSTTKPRQKQTGNTMSSNHMYYTSSKIDTEKGKRTGIDATSIQADGST
jgi:hypothetical protein